jgi:hypothetical protein
MAVRLWSDWEPVEAKKREQHSVDDLEKVRSRTRISNWEVNNGLYSQKAGSLIQPLRTGGFHQSAFQLSPAIDPCDETANRAINGTTASDAKDRSSFRRTAASFNALSSTLRHRHFLSPGSSLVLDWTTTLKDTQSTARVTREFNPSFG